MNEGNRGRALELALDQRHGFYRSAGMYVESNPRRWKVVGKPDARGFFPARPEAQSPPDYTALANGIAVTFDAKCCADDRWSLGNLKAHQAAAFDAWESNRGHAAIYLRFTAPPMLDVWVPWLELEGRWRRWHAGRAAQGEDSLTRESATAAGVLVTGLDWLTAVRFWLAR